MAFELSYAGRPFVIPTDGLKAKIERWLLTRDDPPYSIMPMGSSDFGTLQVRDYKVPRWLGLNELYMPPGANKFGVFRGLMAKQEAQDLIDNTYVIHPTAYPFFMCDGSNAPMTWGLFALPPTPLTGINGASDLYLITLVDERYSWRYLAPFAFGGQWFSASYYADWYSFITSMTASFWPVFYGFPSSEAVYGGPEIDSPMYQTGFSIPPLLQAAFENIGRTIARRNATNGYDVVKYADANTFAAAAAASLASERIAGGDMFKAIGGAVDYPRAWFMPGTIWVKFPRWVDGAGYEQAFPADQHRYRSNARGRAYDSVYSWRVDAGSSGSPYNSIEEWGGWQYLQTTAKSRTLTKGGFSYNTTATNDLAVQIAKDYWDACFCNTRIVFRGIVDFDPRGCTNLLYRYGSDASKMMTLAWSDDPLDRRTEFQHSFGTLYDDSINGMLNVQAVGDDLWFKIGTNLWTKLSSGSH